METLKKVTYSLKLTIMCWVGCLASKSFCIIILIINTALLIGYLFGLLFECKSDCYNSYLLTSVLFPCLLFLCGYIVAIIGFKRGRQDINGCHNIIVAVWLLILTCIVVFVSWNAYNMIYNEIGDNTTIYEDMVYATVIWNIILCLISCNIMIKTEENDGLSNNYYKTKKNYKTLDEEAFEHHHKSNDIHQL